MNWLPWLIVAVVLVGFYLLKRSSFVSADTARQLLQQGALVVDVRSPGEFNSGHLPGALNIPLGNLGEELPRRVPDKSQVLLLHCLSGTRSAMAKGQARQMGYSNVFNLGSYGRAESIVSHARKQ
jgi:phage shock protein E